MGTYRVPVGGKTYTVHSQRDLTVDEILDAVDGRLRDRSPVIPEGAEEFLRDHPRLAQGTAFVLRMVPPLVGGAIGTLVSPGFGTVGFGAGGATLGAAGAQEVELAAGLREERSPGTFTADVATGIVPGARIARDLGRGGKLILAARRGAGFGLAQRSIEIAIDEGRLISPEEAAIAAGGGAVVGTALEGGGRAVGAGIRQVKRLARRGVPQAEARPGEPIPSKPDVTEEIAPEALTEPPAKPAASEPAQIADVDIPGRPDVLLDDAGQAVGETTAAGFEIPRDTPPLVTKPMPPERLPGLAKRIAETAEEEEELVRLMKDVSPELEAQSRGLVPDSEVARMGSEVKPPQPGTRAPGMAAGEFQPGQTFNAEELAGWWMLTRAARDRLSNLRDAVRAAPDDAGLVAAEERARTQYVRALKILTGVRAEAGRALRVAGGPRGVGEAKPGPIERGVQMTRAAQKIVEAGRLKKGVDPESFVSRLVASIDDPITGARIIRESVHVPIGEELKDYVYFAYLSRPVTQTRNILGNTEGFAEIHLGTALGAAVGERGVSAGQVGKPLAAGAYTGFLRGSRKAFEMMMDGVTHEDLQDPDFLFRFLKGESPTELASLRGISLPGDPLLQRIGRGVTRGVPRSLQAVDLMFRTIGKEIRTHQGAYQIAQQRAREQGIKGAVSAREARTQFAAELLGDPDQAKLVELMGKRATFQETPGAFARKLAEMPLAVRLLFFPFVRTPANLFRRGLQKIPIIGSVSAAHEFKRQIRFEGIRPSSEAAAAFRAQMVGESALGYVAITPLVYMAATGMLVGQAPEGAAARARFYEEGKKPTSLIVNVAGGKRAVPLTAFGPAGITAGAVAAAVSELEQNGDVEGYLDKMAAAAGAAGMSLRDASFVTSLKEIFDTGAGGFDLKSVSRVLGRKAAGIAVPGIAQEAERIIDPTVRRALGEEGLGVAKGELLSRVPGLSPEVPARIGTMGEERMEATGETIGQRIFSVLTGTVIITEDPIRGELDRLQESLGKKAPSVGPTPPSDRAEFSIPGTTKKAKLAGASLQAFKQALGQARGAAITQLIKSPEYEEMDDRERAEEIQRETRRAGDDVRKEAFFIIEEKLEGRHPEAITVQDLLREP